MSSWPECPEIQITEYETLGELMLALQTSLPVPCVIVCDGGRARQLITEENKAGIIQGMLLALEHRLEMDE